jgi:beta-lactamase class A
MLKSIQKLLTGILLILVLLFLGYQALQFWLARDQMPPGMTIADVDVSGLNREEAAAQIQQAYSMPLVLHHQTEQIAINPAEVGFALNLEPMLAEADAYRDRQTFWQGYVQYVLGRSLEPAAIQLQATYDQAALRIQLENVAAYLDKPATLPQLLVAEGDYKPGEPGYVTDIEASLPLAEKALFQAKPEERQVNLVLITQEPEELNIHVLEEQLRRELTNAEGMMGAVFIMDLQTGEEVGINADVVMSGLSILKIAIFIEAYRALDEPPDEFVQGLFYDTAVRSSNYGANLLLHIIAGEDNTYEGAARLTQSMQRLGLVNTFMAIPYDAAIVPTRPETYVTPANSQPNILTNPDTARQTTAEDIGTLLSMLYYCSKGGGALLAVYPGEITPAECQAIIDLMVQNTEGNLIRLGVPEGVPVSHKHGWGDNLTHGDAGIVFSPGGDYVIVTYLHQPDGFIVSEQSFPILWELSRLTYNYFNYTDPYLGDPQERAEEAAREREAALATATAQALEAEATATPTP